jgi:hypothetical protein
MAYGPEQHDSAKVIPYVGRCFLEASHRNCRAVVALSTGYTSTSFAVEDSSLNCSKCGLNVPCIGGLGSRRGAGLNREPAPHGEPASWNGWPPTYATGITSRPVRSLSRGIRRSTRCIHQVIRTPGLVPSSISLGVRCMRRVQARFAKR